MAEDLIDMQQYQNNLPAGYYDCMADTTPAIDGDFDNVPFSEAMDVDWATWLVDSAPQEDRTEPRRKKRHSKAQRRILDEWAWSKRCSPYPNRSEMTELATRTNLSPKQVATYLSNFRRRSLPRPSKSRSQAGKSAQQIETASQQAYDENAPCRVPSGSLATSRGGVAASPTSDRSIEHKTLAFSSDEENEFDPSPHGKFDKYKGSLVQWFLDHCNVDEPSSSPPSDPTQVLTSTELGIAETSAPNLLVNFKSVVCSLCGLEREMSCPILDGYIYPPHTTTKEFCFCQQILVHPISETANVEDTNNVATKSRNFEELRAIKATHQQSSKASSRDSCEVDLGARSEESMVPQPRSSPASNSSFMSFGSRQGRRTHAGLPADIGKNLSDDKHTCSICFQRFNRISTFSRHISAVHEGQTRYICGPSIMNDQWLVSLCPQCNEPPNTCEHRIAECWSRPEEKRTFYRKDGFTQHLRKGWHHLEGPCDEAAWNVASQNPMPENLAFNRMELDLTGLV